MPTGYPISEETRRYVVEHYANTPNKELCSFLGISKSAIDRICKEFHLRKSIDHYHRMAIIAGKASSAARGGMALNITPEVIAKRAESYKKTFRLEDIRVRWGLEQKTKIHLRHEPRALQDQRRRLKGMGYIIDDTKRVAYYTDETKRSMRYERRSKKSMYKNYYTFEPISNA